MLMSGGVDRLRSSSLIKSYVTGNSWNQQLVSNVKKSCREERRFGC